MPIERNEPVRVAILGASQATGYGLDVRPNVRRRDRAFPALLENDPSGDFEIINFARDGLNLDVIVAQLDELVATKPDVVVCISGGRESLVRLNYVVRRCRRPIPVKGIPHTPRYHGIERVKTVPWRAVVWLVNRNSALIERIATRLGFGPQMSTPAYLESLQVVIDRVMIQTSAHLFLIREFSGWQGEFAWWPARRIANQDAAAEIAAGNPRISAVAALPMVRSVDNWLPCGAHLNETGHALLAQWLAEEIRAVAT